MHGSVVGILSEGDLLRRVELGTNLRLPVWRAWFSDAGRIAADYVRSHGRKVGEVMTVPAICVTPETELSEVVALMESRRIKRVPVIRDGLLAGIITRSDLIRALGQLLPRVDTRPVADAELRRRLLASLEEQRWARHRSYDVRVADGVAELFGVVTDERQRQALRVVAENTPGIRGVIDRLTCVSLMAGVPLDPEQPSHS